MKHRSGVGLTSEQLKAIKGQFARGTAFVRNPQDDRIEWHIEKPASARIGWEMYCGREFSAGRMIITPENGVCPPGRICEACIAGEGKANDVPTDDQP